MSRWTAAVLLTLLVPLAAAAQEAPQAAPPAGADPTIHRHKGFFIRPELGLGYFATSASQGGLSVKFSGGGAGLGLAIGGAVSEDFIVAGQVWDYVVSDPDVTVNGQTGSAGSETSVGLVGYGVLLNWYFMPSNLYVGVTPSFTKLVLDDGTGSSSSEWGFGVRGAFGKEWWVSDHWGLGLAATIGLASNKSGDGGPSFGSAAFGLNFSATYN